MKKKDMHIEVGKMINVGILDLQGGVEEHFNAINKIKGVNAFRIKKKEQLNQINGLIIPGGESTTLNKLIKLYGFVESIIDFSKEKPIWGTCAGLIILSRRYLNLIDIEVQRNAFGRQSSSFIEKDYIPKISKNLIEMVFIRAPIITDIGSEVNILKKIDGKIVAAETKNILVTSFHPELTEQTEVQEYFIEKIKKYNH
jgi:5'-phosphate synthase pdxT subunit